MSKYKSRHWSETGFHSYLMTLQNGHYAGSDIIGAEARAGSEPQTTPGVTPLRTGNML